MTSKKQRKPTSKKKQIEQSATADPEFGWIGKRIKEIREKRNISQRELAKMCNVDTATMSRMEAGESEPSLKTLRLLAQGLNTTPSALLAQDESAFANSVDLATVEHRLRKYIESQKQSLEDAQLLLAAIQGKTNPQPPVTQREEYSHVRRIEL